MVRVSNAYLPPKNVILHQGSTSHRSTILSSAGKRATKQATETSV